MITIILPVYNSIQYIKDCLDSISKQTFKDWKLLIFDDGSNDGTLEYLEHWVNSEPRATLFKRNQSYIQNLNEGLDLANTKYIARMDSDDIMLPNRLQCQFDFMESHPRVDLVSSSVEVIDAIGNSKGNFGSFFSDCLLSADDMQFMNQIVHPTVLIRTVSLRRKNIRYKPEFKYAEDWELWTQMLENKLELYSMSNILLKYRKYGNSMSDSHQTEISKIRPIILSRLESLRKKENAVSLFMQNYFCKINSNLYFPVVSRCACTTLKNIAIRENLGVTLNNPDDIHSRVGYNLNEYLKNYKDIPEYAIKFAVYRDPVERLLSVYKHFCIDGATNTYFEYLSLKNSSFDRFLEFVQFELGKLNPLDQDEHIRRQSDFYNDYEVDFIVKISDLDDFLKSQGVEPLKIKFNNSSNVHIDITSENKERIIKMYENDYSMLNSKKIWVK